MEPQNTDTEKQDTVTELFPPEPAPEQSVFKCDECERAFKSPPALRMHKVRKHSGKGWNTSGNFRNAPQSKAEKLEKRRAYNRKWRLARGMKPRSWTPERKAKFQATMRKNAMRKNKMQLSDVAKNHHAAAPTPVSSVAFCPRCGCNIKVVAAAIAFGDNQ